MNMSESEAPVEEFIEAPSFEEEVEQLVEEESVHHTILQVWREILGNAPADALKKPTPSWCSRISQTHGLKVQEMRQFNELFYATIADLREILEFEIESDPDCLSRLDIELDRDENAVHYKNIIRDWQLQVLQWELDFECTDEDAHIQIAAVSEVHRMFFGDKGLFGFLDNIGLEFTSDDQEELQAVLEAHKAQHAELKAEASE